MKLSGKDSLIKPLSLFSVTIYCWMCSLLLRLVCFPSESPLDETKFTFESGYQIEIVPELEKGTCVHFFFQLEYSI